MQEFLLHHAVQGSAKRQNPGLVNFVPALSYHLSLALPAAFTQPGNRLLAEPCILMVIFTLI